MRKDILFIFMLIIIVVKNAGTIYAYNEPETWLPQNKQAASEIPDLNTFIKPLGGKARLLICNYNDSRLTATHLIEHETLIINKNRWRCKVDANQVECDRFALDFVVTFKLEQGTAKSSGVAVAFDFDNWSEDNYVLIPASVYNGNRCTILNQGYAQGLPREYLYKKDIPLMSVPIPQLSPVYQTRSKLEINSCNAATPAMCFYSKTLGKSFIVLTEQKTRFADNGFIIEESMDRKTATFVISAPGVRERKPLFVGFSNSSDRGANLNAGEEISLRMRLYLFDTPNIPGLLDKFMTVRKSVTGPNNPRNLIPFSQTIKWMTERIDSRWHDGKEFKFYCPENAKWISFGWIGGLMNTFPMLALNDETHLDRVIKTFDFAIPGAQGKAGYFYGAINHDGKCFGREGYNEQSEIVLTRKNADVLFWMIKQFELLHAQGRSDKIKPEWTNNIKRLADAFVKTWKQNEQWGRMLNNNTGQVAEYNTSGGVMAIGGLALASNYYNNSEYLKVAIDAAELYYMRDYVNQGQTTGGCADILQNADSETAAGFMTALMTLYEITGDTNWLEKSRNLANLSATWTTSYDYKLPKDTELGRLGAKLAGAYWASTQNKHAAPGICTSSGDALFKIYRATGDIRYADLLYDIVHAHAESIRPGGFTNERLTYCDADSRGERGHHVTGWNELNGILMAMEIPGIYIQTDVDNVFIFDHIEAETVSRNENGITMRITNRTAYDAAVSIFAESEKQAKLPLGNTAFIK